MPGLKTNENPIQADAFLTNQSRDGWNEFINVFPVYAALARQCKLAPPAYSTSANPTPWPDQKAKDRDLAWMRAVDSQTQAVHLRQFLATPYAAKEESLRAFLQRQLLKRDKTAADRDKIDLLVVQYFALCATPELIAAGLDRASVARVLQPVLGTVEDASLECCEPLERILTQAEECRTLREFVDRGLMDQGRMAKEAAGGMFYDPPALVSFCRFNFLFRRTFIRLLHSDLRSINDALIELERRGIKTVDCRRAGLSTQEPLAKLREFQQRWKAPFQTDYMQPGAFRSYDQLLSLRVDIEDALASCGRETPDDADSARQVIPDGLSGTAESLQEISAEIAAETGSAAPPPARYGDLPAEKPAVNRTEGPATMARATPAPGLILTPEECEERIWEQLIATPPIRGRSMTTVTIEEARILLSAWEVTAFVNESGPESEEIRRAIVARALVAIGVDRRKRFLDVRALHRALSVAREGIPRFQEHIEQLKRSKKVESAVNLGITLKRLLSLVDEAEQLQREGNSAVEER